MTIYAETIKSDSLTTLRPLFDAKGVFNGLGHIFKMAVIVDANFVIRDILWLTRKRKKPESRTELYEVLLAGTIAAYAPTFLEEEIQANLPKLAHEFNVSVDALDANWQVYKALIKFVDAGGPDGRYEDPKDAPYIKLQAELGALILSKDSDIKRMGGQVADACLVARLRMYSRHVAVEYTLKAGSAATFTISLTTLAALRKLITSAASHLMKLPKWIWLVLAVLLVVAVMHPPTRQYILGFIQTSTTKSKTIGARLLSVLEDLITAHEQAKKAAEAALAGLQTAPIAMTSS